MPMTCTGSDQVIPLGIDESQTQTHTQSMKTNTNKQYIIRKSYSPSRLQCFLCKDVKGSKTVGHTKHLK